MIGCSVWFPICSRHFSSLCGFIGDGNSPRAAGARSIIFPVLRTISPALACRCPRRWPSSSPASSFLAALEIYMQSELDLPRRNYVGGNAPSRRVPDQTIRCTIILYVEKIEELSSERHY